jgi:transposase-like protein
VDRITKLKAQRKEIDEETKRRIADLYQNTRMSIGAIAHYLEISSGTVSKYKNLQLSQSHSK